MAKRQTNPDHKYRLGYTGSCSCGWTGNTWFGPGARANAATDWSCHRAKCEAAK